MDKKFETARQATSYVNSLLDEPLVEEIPDDEDGGSGLNACVTASPTSHVAAGARSSVSGNRIVEDPDSAPHVPFDNAPHMGGQPAVVERHVYDGDDEEKMEEAFAAQETSTSVSAVAVAAPSVPTSPSSVHAQATPIDDSEAVLGKSSATSGPQAGGISSGEPHVVPAEPLNSSMLHLPATGAENTKKVAQYHPACQAAALQELKIAMGQLFHVHSKNCDLVPRVADDSGTCKVQVLRSIGKWSVGTRTECSIMNCWVETIQGAQRFIYIENQFFIGNNAGDGVMNGIPAAIVERILAAHALKEVFRVIIVIPVHPNGDYANAMKSKVVMHYQYQTINRGLTSMFSVLRKKAPGINVSDYIGFFSLRSWGVMNNKVVSDQVYVHDKLLIVDDRIAVIGSANINDRSMIGCRDSEVAIRIEDTLHLDTTMNGQPHTVGYLPHTLRLRLMKQHIRDESIGEFLFVEWQLMTFADLNLC